MVPVLRKLTDGQKQATDVQARDSGPPMCRGGGDSGTAGTPWGEGRGEGRSSAAPSRLVLWRRVCQQPGAAAEGRGTRVRQHSARGRWFGSLRVSRSMFSIH